MEVVERLGDKYPTLSLGQLIINIAIFAGREPDEVYERDEDKIVAPILKHFGQQ